MPDQRVDAARDGARIAEQAKGAQHRRVADDAAVAVIRVRRLRQETHGLAGVVGQPDIDEHGGEQPAQRGVVVVDDGGVGHAQFLVGATSVRHGEARWMGLSNKNLCFRPANWMLDRRRLCRAPKDRRFATGSDNDREIQQPITWLISRLA